MKNQILKLTLVGTTALLLNVGWVRADSTSTATPTASTGSPSGTFGDNNKNGQELNSPGADRQKTASMPENSKKTHLKPHGTVANDGVNQRGPLATKTPQQASVPASTAP
jgi:hypothetical protein